MTPGQITFLVLATIAVLGAVGVVAFGNNPVRSALSLVLNFFVLAFIYFTLAAQLLGITQIMVYAGAIMVLFLFVIMILRLQNKDDKLEKPDPRLPMGILVGGGLAFMVFAQVIAPLQGNAATPIDNAYGLPQAIGRELFTTYVWPFEITSVLLLVGIVGSILLAKRRLTK